MKLIMLIYQLTNPNPDRGVPGGSVLLAMYSPTIMFRERVIQFSTRAFAAARCCGWHQICYCFFNVLNMFPEPVHHSISNNQDTNISEAAAKIDVI